MNQEWIIIIFSTICFSIGVLIWQKSNRLHSHGKKTIGIIIENIYKGMGSSGLYYPVIRFITDEKARITKELNIGFKPARPDGSKVKVIYNVHDPYDFQIDSIFMRDILPRILVALGIAGIAYGLLQYLEYI